ncbi:hypothetical protein KC675_04890 [Candidatus Dojkabacteria bacterium]|jgi:hypothetical protein|uniref:Uncharacterized protein n=1 Tax=Candidatus Dojkabacteria bacterium TaxID=2099670 RepID=A0A955IEI4_9BACT|nr:hypothetical protein [Candidatus Dojkabacteria bacterium]
MTGEDLSVQGSESSVNRPGNRFLQLAAALLNGTQVVGRHAVHIVGKDGVEPGTTTDVLSADGIVRHTIIADQTGQN